MAKKLQVYKCAHSPLTVEILTEGDECFDIACCGEKMIPMNEQTADKTVEKHVPIVTGDAKGVKVTVGCTPHPMTEDHYIQWIEVVNGPYVNRKYLQPGDKPEAEFYVPLKPGLIVREYCNKHGLWKG